MTGKNKQQFSTVKWTLLDDEQSSLYTLHNDLVEQIKALKNQQSQIQVLKKRQAKLEALKKPETPVKAIKQLDAQIQILKKQQAELLAALYHEIFTINLSLTLLWLYAKNQKDNELKKALQQNLQLLSNHPYLKDKCFILAADSPYAKLLFKAFEKLCKTKADVTAQDITSFTKHYLHAMGITDDGSSDASSAFATDDEDSQAELLSSADTISEELELLHHDHEDLLFAIFGQVIAKPWRNTLSKALLPKRLSIMVNQWGAKNLQDTLLGFYKLNMHQDIHQLYKSAEDKNHIFDKLFALYLDAQNKEVKNLETLKALKKSLNNAAEYFGYHHRLVKNAEGDYEKLPALGRKANPFLLDKFNLQLSNKISRRTSKEIFNYAAWIISLIVALGTAAMVFVAVIAVPWISLPLAIVLTVAAFTTNLILFKGSMYKFLVRIFIKKDLFSNLSTAQKTMLGFICVCCFFSSVALGALTFTSMLALLSTMAFFPPAIPVILAAIVATATVLASTALLFSAACDLVRNNFYIKEIKAYFVNAWKACKEADSLTARIAAICKLIALPTLAVLALAAIIASTFAIGSALWTASGALIAQITTSVQNVPALFQFFTGFGPLIVKVCTISTVVMEGTFNIDNLINFAMRIGDLIKTTTYTALNFMQRGIEKCKTYFKAPQQAVDDLKAVIPGTDDVKKAAETIVQNPYYLAQKMQPAAEIVSSGIVILNAISNGITFTGHTGFEQNAAVRELERAAGAVNSFACNDGPAKKLIAGTRPTKKEQPISNTNSFFQPEKASTKRKRIDEGIEFFPMQKRPVLKTNS